MKKIQTTIQIPTHAHNGLYDITRQVKEFVSRSGVQNGMVSVYVQGATAAIIRYFHWVNVVHFQYYHYKMKCHLNITNQMLLGQMLFLHQYMNHLSNKYHARLKT